MANINKVNNVGNAPVDTSGLLHSLRRSRSVLNISKDALKEMTKRDLLAACDHYEIVAWKNTAKSDLIDSLMEHRDLVMKMNEESDKIRKAKPT